MLIVIGHTPTSVCFNNNVRGSLPALQKWFHNKPLMEQPLHGVKKKEIFELAKSSTNFYKLIVELQVKELQYFNFVIFFCTETLF